MNDLDRRISVAPIELIAGGGDYRSRPAARVRSSMRDLPLVPYAHTLSIRPGDAENAVCLQRESTEAPGEPVSE